MALKLDDPSIIQALKLKHYKDFCTAIKVNDEPTKKLRVKDFRTKFNALSLSDAEEKGWVQTIGATVVATGKSIADSLTWAVALRLKLNGTNLDTLRNCIEKLGANAPDLFGALDVGSNMLTNIVPIAATLGPASPAWILHVPTANRNIASIQQFLDKLKVDFTQNEIRSLWTRFQGLDTGAIWSLGDQIPATLHCAYLHTNLIAPDIFWMTGLADSAKARSVAEKVYSDATYQNKAKTMNTIATRLKVSIDEPWVKLFTCVQLADIHETLVAAVPLLIDRFFGTAGTIASTHAIVAATTGFRTWISDYCDTVALLAHNGYPINVIMKMHEKGLGERLMISCTWFRRRPVTTQLTFFFKVWADPNNTARGLLHGGLTANGMHLALRHLYEHFNFTQIENKNSFHPRHTTAQDLVNLSANNTLAHMNQNSKQLVGNIYLVVTNHSSASERRVKSLYPNLLTTHPDYFTRTQVEAMRDVVALIPANLPEL